MNSHARRSPLASGVVRGAGWIIAWFLALSCSAWAFGALYYDFPVLNDAAALAFALSLLAAIVFVRGAGRKLGATLFGCALVLGWWLTLKPSSTRAWQPDVAQEPWAEVEGDEITLHNVRNCDYRSETDYTPRWETRTVRLSQLTGIDLAINYWGSPWMAHPIASFQIANAPPLCFGAFLGLCFTRVRPVGFNDEPGEPLVRQYHPQPLECSAETVARQDQELDVNEGPSQFGEQPGLAHAE